MGGLTPHPQGQQRSSCLWEEGVSVGRVLHPSPSSRLGASGVWERKPLFLLCFLVAYFLRLAPSARGFAWDPIRLCRSPLAKFSSPLEPRARRLRDRKNNPRLALV